MTKQTYRPPCGGRVASRIGDAAGVNDDCHKYTGGVTMHEGRILASPFVYPIFWGSAYSSRGPTGALTSEHEALTSIVSFIQSLGGVWLDGLRQYGVNSVGSFWGMSDTLAPGTDPASLTDTQIEQELIRYITWSQVGVPTANELQRCFLLFLPNTADMTDEPGACGYHRSTYYGKTSGDHNLFYAVIGMKGVAASLSGDDLIKKVSFCISHELAEMFTNPDGRGWFADADPANGRTDNCEIGDICEKKGYVLAVGKWTVEKFWSQKDTTCYDPSSPAPAPIPDTPVPEPRSVQPPPHVICQTLAVRIGHLESQILQLTREPRGPANSALLAQLEAELSVLQTTYQQDCQFRPGRPRHIFE